MDGIRFARELISEEISEHEGYGAGEGTINTYTYRCACGKGTVVQIKYLIPGFEESAEYINCPHCSKKFLE
jgi:DNA-directed RNA polymerase subunit RPC12/RpoP